MSAPISSTYISMEGILTPVPVSLNEYTSPAIIAQYSAKIAILKEILNRTASNPVYNGNPPPLTAQDAINAKDAIVALQSLAQNGITSSTNWAVPNDTTQPQTTYYMTSQMGSNLDLILKSLSAVGFTSTSFNLDNLKAWQSLGGYGIAGTMQAAIDAGSATNNRSIQSFIELEYVTTANDVIFSNLTNMQTALSTTGTVLGTLQTLQDIQNKMFVSGPSNLGPTFSAYFASVIRNALSAANKPFGAQVSPESYSDLYKAAANNYFAQVIPKINAFSEDQYISIYNTVLAARTQISNYIIQLGIQAPNASRTIPNTLAFNLNKLLTDMNNQFTPTTDRTTQLVFIKQWIIDGRQGLPTATGVIQDHITTAITSAENLNDTQKENIRNYMFIFEQFYKSATAALTAISQILQKMAQNISR